jgi:hypothetical protein
MLILPGRFSRQPQSPTRIDWGNPLTRGLVFLLQDGRNAVSQVQLTGTASRTLSQFGNTLSFNGSSDGLYESVSNVDKSAGFSAHVIVRPDNNTQTNTFIGLGTATSGPYVVFDLSGTEVGDPLRVISFGTSGSGTRYTPTFDWSAYTAVWNQGSNNQLYRNGVLLTPTSSTGDGNLPDIVNYGVGVIVAPTAGNRANARIPFAAIWRRRLSAQEALQLAENPWQLFAPQRKFISLPDPTRPGMASRPKRWTKQPQGNVEIDWGNPITRGLATAYLPTARYPGIDLVTKVFDTSTTRGSLLPGTNGVRYAVTGTNVPWTLNFAPVGILANYPAVSVFTLFEQYDTTTTGVIFGGGNNASQYARFEKNNNGSISFVPNTNSGGSAIAGPVLNTNQVYALAAINQGNERELFVDAVSQISSNTSITFINGAYGYAGSSFLVVNHHRRIGLYCGYVWTRRLTPFEIKSLTDNPWQIFAPQRTYVFPNPANLPIISRPSSDVLKNGWVPSQGSQLYPMVNEVIPDNSTWIDSPVVDGSPGPAVMGIDNSLTTGTIIVRVRAKKLANAGRFRVLLLDSSGNTVGTSSWQSVTSTITDYALSVATSGTTARVSIEVAS